MPRATIERLREQTNPRALRRAIYADPDRRLAMAPVIRPVGAAVPTDAPEDADAA